MAGIPFFRRVAGAAALAAAAQFSVAQAVEPVPKGVTEALKREAESLATTDEAVVRQRWGVWADLIGTSWSWFSAGHARWVEFRWWIPGAAVRYNSVRCRDGRCDVEYGIAIHSPKDSVKSVFGGNPSGLPMFNIYWSSHPYVHDAKVRPNGVDINGFDFFALDPSGRVLKVDGVPFMPSSREQLSARAGVTLAPAAEDLVAKPRPVAPRVESQPLLPAAARQ